MYVQTIAANMTSPLSPSASTTNKHPETEMKRMESSNDPVDVVTLAYIWAYPLIAHKRLVDYSTSPNVPPGPITGPVNTFNNALELMNASFTDVVRANAAWIDLKKEPLVLQVPSISDRYYVLQITDAYTNNFFYIGTRTNVASGGTYLITGPNWDVSGANAIPYGMKEIIKSPTNTVAIALRILVKGPEDVSNVRALQDKFVLCPLSSHLLLSILYNS
jgi:hypothetical protein